MVHCFQPPGGKVMLNFYISPHTHTHTYTHWHSPGFGVTAVIRFLHSIEVTANENGKRNKHGTRPSAMRQTWDEEQSKKKKYNKNTRTKFLDRYVRYVCVLCVCWSHTHRPYQWQWLCVRWCVLHGKGNKCKMNDVGSRQDSVQTQIIAMRPKWECLVVLHNIMPHSTSAPSCQCALLYFFFFFFCYPFSLVCS